MTGPTCCCNCKREQVSDDVDPTYRLDIQDVSSDQLKKKGGFKFLHQVKARGRVTTHYLCKECYQVFVEGDTKYENTWPAFIWNILNGSTSNTSEFICAQPFN